MRVPTIVLVMALAVTGCVQMTKVGGPQLEHDIYRVNAPSDWNRWDEGNTVLWTKDGFGLQQITFFRPAAEGESLGNTAAAKEPPKFRADMKPTDTMDFILATMSAAGLQAVEGSGLRPHRFAGERGFRFKMSYQTRNGSLLVGDAFAAVIDDKLHVVTYVGHPEFYYGRHLEEAEKLIQDLTF